MIQSPKGIKHHLILMMFIVSISIIVSAFFSGYLVYLVLEPYPVEATDKDMEVSLEFADFLWISLLMVFTGLIVSVIMAYRTSKKTLLSIDALGKAAQSLTDGDLTARVAKNPNDNFTELTQLEHNFNLMAAQLEQKQKNLTLWNAGIAHELRNPVTILKGKLQGVLDGVFTPDNGLIQTLLQQTENLSQLIEDLRLLSLIENNHLRLNCVLVNTEEIIQEQLANFSPLLNERRLHPVLKLEKITFSCDPIRIQQILFALLENAVRYSNTGKIYLTSSMINDHWHFTLEDEGPGIKEIERPYIFEFFYRANHPDGKISQGTGLGLTIVKHLVEAHQGNLTYSPSPYGGSCFSFKIPFLQPAIIKE